jgi:predicted Zn-ribbon and HTH transcriptional regulator
MAPTVSTRRTRALTIRRRVVAGFELWECACPRCSYRWLSRSKAKPTRCAKCKAKDFDKPARAYQRKKR